MKIYSKKEIDSIGIFETRKNPIYEELDKIACGEALFVAKHEWSYKSNPNTVINGWAKKMLKQFKTKTTETGYFILRIK